MAYGLEQGPRASFLGIIVTPPKFSSTPPCTCRRELPPAQLPDKLLMMMRDDEGRQAAC